MRSFGGVQVRTASLRSGDIGDETFRRRSQPRVHQVRRRSTCGAAPLYRGEAVQR